MKWQRVEVTDPHFRTRKQGRRQGAFFYVGTEPMVIMRVVSPTVAYVQRMGDTEKFMTMMGPTDTPFLDYPRRSA